MFCKNSGYVGASRSVRSAYAIDNYEVPITMINRNLIDKFLKENQEELINDLEILKPLSIAKWKYVCRTMPATSWHHTSKHFNKTSHYDLNEVAEEIIKRKATLEKDYKEHLKEKKKKKSDVEYGVIKVQVWGGTRRYPKVVGYDTQAGIIVGDWLYYQGGKYKTNANKVEWLKKYNSYSDLVKKHPEYKGTVKKFNKLIKERK